MDWRRENKMVIDNVPFSELQSVSVYPGDQIANIGLKNFFAICKSYGVECNTPVHIDGDDVGIILDDRLLTEVGMKPQKSCLYPECGDMGKARGLCYKHYQRAKYTVKKGIVSWKTLEEQGKSEALVNVPQTRFIQWLLEKEEQNER